MKNYAISPDTAIVYASLSARKFLTLSKGPASRVKVSASHAGFAGNVHAEREIMSLSKGSASREKVSASHAGFAGNVHAERKIMSLSKIHELVFNPSNSTPLRMILTLSDLSGERSVA